MKFVKTEIKLDVYGQEATVRFPTMGELSALDTDQRKDGVDEVELLISFLDKLGLKRELSSTMEPDHIKQVMEVFKGK